MTESEFFENIKLHGRFQNRNVFDKLFTVSESGEVKSTEGKWFKLIDGKFAVVVDTAIPRMELEQFWPQPSSDYAALNRLVNRPKTFENLNPAESKIETNLPDRQGREIPKINFPTVGKTSKAFPKNIKRLTSAKSIDITLGIFFDGTGNNRYCTELIHNHLIDSKTLFLDKNKILNIEKRISIPNSKKIVEVEDYMIDIVNGSSYLNSYSNIALLYDLYETKPFNKNLAKSQEVVIKEYVQGIGTLVDLDKDGIPIKYYPDDWRGMATGIGPRGIVSRVTEALEAGVAQIKRQTEINELNVRKITIDLFGFSRGAAAARHCANELIKPEIREKKNGKEDADQDSTGTIKQVKAGIFGELLTAGNIEIPEIIEVRFLGLFDTVVSDFVEHSALLKSIFNLAPFPFKLIVSENSIIEKKNLSLKNLKCKTLHIVAMDENRENFPLTVCDAPNTHTLNLYGSHSDIGGGYVFTNYETYIGYKDIKNDKEKAAYEEMAESYRKNYAYEKINGEWATNKDQIKTILAKVHNPVSSKYAVIPHEKSDHYVIVDNRRLSNNIALVAMNAMLQYARLENVPFLKDVNKLETESKKFCTLPSKIPAYLKKYYDSVEKIIVDPVLNIYRIDPDDYYQLYQNYVHISANFNSSVYFNQSAAESEFYVNQPTVDGLRRSITPYEYK